MSRRPGTPGQRNPARPGMSFTLEGLRFGNIGALLENAEWVFGTCIWRYTVVLGESPWQNRVTKYSRSVWVLPGGSGSAGRGRVTLKEPGLIVKVSGLGL